MLCVFTSELLLTVEAAIDKFAGAVSIPKTGEDAAAKAASMWKKKASAAEPEANEPMFQKYLSGIKNVVEGGATAEIADFGVGDGHNGLTYVKGEGKIFVGVDEGRVANVACYFQGKLLEPAPIAGPGGRRASMELPSKILSRRGSMEVPQLGVRRHSFRHDIPTEDELDAHQVMEAYINVAMAHNVGGCHVAHKDLSTSTTLDAHMRRIRGKFAFVLYDKQRKRIIAGRDPKGTEPLFWATDTEGLRLYFATDKNALSEHGDRVKEFPAGGLYISKAAELAGTLNGQPLPDPRYIWMEKPKFDNSKLQGGSLMRRSSVELQYADLTKC